MPPARFLCLLLFFGLVTTSPAQKRSRPAPEDLNRTPLEAADLNSFPAGTDHIEVVLLMGQSNMKGRGVMPETPLSDPRILMMHKGTDRWFRARHPLHLVGDPETFEGADNAGVGPGLVFAQRLAASNPKTKVALIPCAVGGTSLAKWQKGERLYEEAVRRAKLAMAEGPEGRIKIVCALWLQGEADSNSPQTIAAYPGKLKQMIADLRTDLSLPELPFLACTIGELKAGSEASRARINEALLDLPNQVAHSACIDSREFAADIGDSVHFDTATQEKHGALFAEAYFELRKHETADAPKE